ncbi:MAG: hypothetical protein ACRD4X_06450 [Candidatus Acidiferrales bacterium]
MMLLKQSLIATFFLLVSLPAGAQMFGRPQIPQGVFNPVVGAGAEYAMQNSNGRKNTMDFAIVGKDTADGHDGYWMEFTMSGSPMGDIVVKMLAVVTGGNMVMSKMIMQMPGRPPMEMPAQMQNANRGTNLADIRNKADDLGTESITTPAGTFSCHHYKMKDGSGEAWVSEAVHPFGLVKNQDKDGSTVVLVKTLTGVKDKITGTPQPFNPMNMMPQQPTN